MCWRNPHFAAWNHHFAPFRAISSKKHDSCHHPTQHIAQDQGSTAGTVTSSGLSEGRASRMSWQSSDGQREELLDALRVETAKVKPESEETN
jgi:hypothetical protein